MIVTRNLEEDFFTEHLISMLNYYGIGFPLRARDEFQDWKGEKR